MKNFATWLRILQRQEKGRVEFDAIRDRQISYSLNNNAALTNIHAGITKFSLHVTDYVNKEIIFEGKIQTHL